MPRKADSVEGTCALTGERGKYVRSHILPRALTHLTSKGEKAIEGGLGLPLVRRPATWYDNQLVTSRGEAILEKIDTAGIAELRKHRLIWGSWNGSATIPTDDVAYESGEPHSRIIDVPRPEILRLFFISLALARRRIVPSRMSMGESQSR